jgi:hypothetical protein
MGNTVNLRQAYLSMIKRFPGGWDAICGALGMSRDALENRIYERRGQSVLVETALQMQAFTDSTCFAEAIAALSGGTFVRIAQGDAVGNQELLAKFNALHAHIGRLVLYFTEATADEQLDRSECAHLSAIGDEIHRATQELLALVFRIYRKTDAVRRSDDGAGA